MELGPGTILDGKYTLLRAIGTGSAGAVYEAEHLIVGKHVAIKVLHPLFAKDRVIRMSFAGEARAAAQIGHANVVDVYDLGVTDDGFTYLVMELLRGETLDVMLSQRGALAPAYACELMLQVLAGLDAAHREGIVHRDLKPANVIVTYPRPDRPLVKVLDFGIAKGVADAMAEDGADAPICGTPTYMAPEVMSNAADERTDVYAVAAMLFEMLCGEDAVVGGSPIEIMMNSMLGKHRHLSEMDASIPVALAAVIERALSTDPEDRPGSARELAALLRPFVAPDRVYSLCPAPGTTVLPIPLVKLAAADFTVPRTFTLPGPAPDLISVRCPALDLTSLSAELLGSEAADRLLRDPQIPKAPIAPQPYAGLALRDGAAATPSQRSEHPVATRAPSIRAQAEARKLESRARAWIASGIGVGLGGMLAWFAFLPWWQ